MSADHAGLWFAGPKSTVRHLASFGAGGFVVELAGGAIRYRGECDRSDIIRRPGDPHPVDTASKRDLPPCSKCLNVIENRVWYLTEILTTNGRPS